MHPEAVLFPPPLFLVTSPGLRRHGSCLLTLHSLYFLCRRHCSLSWSGLFLSLPIYSLLSLLEPRLPESRPFLFCLYSLIIPHGVWLVVGTTWMRGWTRVVGVGNTLGNGVSETSRGIISNSQEHVSSSLLHVMCCLVVPLPTHSPPCIGCPVGHGEGVLH